MSMRLCLSLVLLSAGVLAQDGALPDSRAEAIRAAVQKELDKQKIPAMTVSVGHRGSVVFNEAFGRTDLENDVKATTTSRFRTASIAKPMTAVAVMQLAERGKLDLDAGIQKYCPEFPEKRWKVTCRQLLGHLSGVRHYNRPGEASGTEFFYTLTDTLRLFKDDPLDHRPETKMTYTTFGYTLLGIVVERASGLSYAEYMAENVWGPAGMKHTVTDNHYTLVKGRARGYQKLGQREHAEMPASIRRQVKVGDIFNAGLHDTSMKIPGGGLLSTSSDLVRFGIAMLANRLVKPETRQLMWTSMKTSSGQESGYGMGFGIRKGNLLRVQHSGGQAGTTTLMVILPEHDMVVAAMCNLQRARIGALIRDVGLTALGRLDR